MLEFENHWPTLMILAQVLGEAENASSRFYGVGLGNAGIIISIEAGSIAHCCIIKLLGILIKTLL